MESLNARNVDNIVVKQEPIDEDMTTQADDREENNNSNRNGGLLKRANSNTDMNRTGIESKSAKDHDQHSSSSQSNPLRYISRRGRPPGGGYSMKSAMPSYTSYSQTALGLTSHDFLRQSTLGAAGVIPETIIKSGLDPSLDALDSRRFGLHCFDTDKHSFRCDGCDVVFSSRDTYAMHMLLRAKNESCVALPTSAISANPENPTPREKFERELREKAMLHALRSQAAIMSKAVAAAAAIPRSSSVVDTVMQPMSRSSNSSKDDLSGFGASDLTAGLNTLFAFDTYGLYMDQRQYRRLLSEYSLRAATSPGSLSAIMEQMSCSVCGEVFPNKDSLAMHMMFHTRDEEGDSKPNIIPSWKTTELSSNPKTKMSPLSINTENSPTGQTVKHSNASHSSSKSSRKIEGDRQLTVERIEELKRMAIESSLKSSMKKHQTNNVERNPRPKSVSEESKVTSSAQPRPLSADDVCKFNINAEKGIYKPHKMIFRSTSGEHHDDKHKNKFESYSDSSKVPFRKRTMSISDDYLKDIGPVNKKLTPNSAIVLQKENEARSKVQFRYDKSKSTGEVAFPKLCDNHVSSASGPQDSDETSNGSSNAALENNTQATMEVNITKSRNDDFSTSIDNLMSGKTILVPVENTDDLQVEGDMVGTEYSMRMVLGKDYDIESKRLHSPPELSKSKHESIGQIDNSDSDICSRNGSSSGSPVNLNALRANQSKLNRSFSLEQDVYTDNDNVDDISRRKNEKDSVVEQHRIQLISDIAHAPPASSNVGKEVMGRRSLDTSGGDSSRAGEARYCPHCEILFLDVTLFHLHMGLHNVNNPWQCNICGLVCAGRLEFNTHVLHF